jgi:hypothetical protein
MSRLILGLALGLFVLPAFAENSTGVISGVVTDPSGGVVPGASVGIINSSTNVRAWEGKSNSQGEFVAPSLPAGSYNVDVEAPGFSKFSVTSFDLKVDQRARIDAKLQPGQISNTITVTGENVIALDNETSSLGLVVDPNQVQALPMAGHALLNLVLLADGVSAGGDATSINQSQISINGSRTQTQEVLVDGVSTLDGTTGSIGHLPSPDAVREFKVMTSSYSAEYGRTGGSTLAMVVNSGTNRYHGGLYEYFRNEDLNANNFFYNLQGLARPVTRVNQYGGKLGGPVAIPKLFHGNKRIFFFTDYEGAQGSNPALPSATIPDMRYRQGDFSSTTVVVNDPATHAPFPGNKIPASRLDPAAQKIVNLLPAPNSPGTYSAATGQTANDFVNSQSIVSWYDDITSRVDYNMSAKSRLFAKLTRYWAQTPQTSIIPGPLDPRQGALNDGQWNSAIGDTYTFSPTVILDLHGGVLRKTRNQPPPSLGINVPSQMGIQRAPVDIAPEINMTGWTDVGALGNTWTVFAENIFQYSGSLTWVKGGQTIRVGAGVRKEQYNTFNPGSSFAGSYYFTGAITSPSQAAGPAINSLADFLLGAINNASYVIPQPESGRRTSNTDFYFQDDWKVTRKLTVNLGLREEYEAPLTVANGIYSRVDVNTGKLLVAGVNASQSLNLNPPKINLGPRIGYAYAVEPKTVIRSGFGLFYGQLFENLGGVVNYPGFTITETFGQLGRGVPQNFSLTQGIPFTPVNGYNPLQTAANATLSNPLVPSVEYAEVNHLPTNLEWNWGVQHELGTGTVIEANYVGSHGYHLPLSLRWNVLPSFQIAELETSTGTQVATQQYRPFPTVQAANAIYNIGSSSYHALQLRGTRQFSNAASFLVSYTYSKAIDDGSGLFSNTQPAGTVDYGQVPQIDRSLDRSVGAFDRRHNLVLAPQYTTKFGPRWVHDFTINGIFTVRSGLPVTVTQSNLFPDVLEQRPNINAPISQLYAPQEVTNGTGIQYLRKTSDPSFPLTATGPLFGTVNGKTTMILPADIGNLGRFAVRAPGDVNLNLTIGKRFALTERLGLQLRAEAYNAINHTNLLLPATSLSVVANSNGTTSFNSPGFGLITSARSARFMQMVARFEF